MAVKDGELTDADGVMNSVGSNFNDIAQNIFNADYIGFDSRLTNNTTPNLKNVFYSTFTSDDADTNFGFDYDSTNDLYSTPDIDSTEYIIIEATSLSGPWDDNNCKTSPFVSGKWLVYCTTGTDAVHRAQIHKSLWYGTNGTDALIDDFTSVTAVKTSHANDVDKRAILAEFSNTGSTPATEFATGTFNDTSTNNNSSFWSDLTATSPDADGVSMASQFALGNQVNITAVSPPGTDDSFEMGTDTSADELTNPANCKVNYIAGGSGASGRGSVIILCEGTLTWALTTITQDIDIDYTADNSIPVMTAADTLANEGVNIATLIFKDTASASVTHAMSAINSTIDATSSEQISISANGGSNWTDVNNTEVARPTAGTALWRKIVITRTDVSKGDIVTEQAVKYNFY